MFVGVHARARRFGVLAAAVGVLAIVVGVTGTVQAAPAPRAKAAAKATNSSCGTHGLPAPAQTAQVVAAAGEGPFNIGNWLGEKIAGGGAGAAGGLAFNDILALTGLKDKLSATDPVVARLDRIETQIKGVNERLDQITGQLDTLTKLVVVGAVNTDLTNLCKKVVEVEDLYANHFLPSVQAGAALGKIWTEYSTENAQKYAETRIGELPDTVRNAVYPEAGDVACPDPKDKAQLACNTPKELVNYRLDHFRDVFTNDKLSTAPGFISNYLTVHTSGASLMTDYGAFLMTKRTLTSPDSQALQNTYDQFAETEALAVWMSMEYYAATTALGVNPNGVLSSYKDDKKLERDDLPPLIPEGDIINLGKKGADTTRNRSIWTLASTQDTTYWPINVESNNDVTTTADGATTAVDAFNRDQSCSVDAPCFNHWRIPNGIELKALVSDDCKVDQTTSQFPAGCKPIANGAVGSPNVVTVLAGLDPTDVTWTGVFCNGRSVKPIPVSCVTPPDQHTFIWTTDRRSHNTDCGYHVGLFGIHYPVYSRIYSLRVGLALDSTNVNSEWPIYPTMPPQIPGYGAWDSTLAHTKCDQYTRTQIPLATNKGIVLVTDNTDMVDFMAQPGNAALQDTTARKVAEQAAADARRYGRHHRGRFSGLTLHRLRDDVPEARSGEPAYLVAAHAIDQGTGFTVTARAEGTDDSFTISDRPSGAVLHGCTRVHGGAGRHGCQHVKRGHGRW